jgi:multidrug efflux pump subunit AcrB
MSYFDLEKDWPGMNWLSGGEAEETQASILNLIFSFVLALLGVYFLLVLLFNSFTQPLLVMVAVPFGAIGVIIAFIVHRENPSFLAMMGGIGLTGVVVNDSLVLVNHLNNLRKNNPNAPIREIIAEGTSDRLRAIMLTTLTTVSALLPLAYGIGGVDIYMSPLALVMGWGLMFATPLTLVLIPCLYEVGNDLARVVRKKLIS